MSADEHAPLPPRQPQPIIGEVVLSNELERSDRPEDIALPSEQSDSPLEVLTNARYERVMRMSPEAQELEIKELIRKAELAEQHSRRMTELANYDPKTGALQEAPWRQELAARETQFQRDNTPYTVLHLDLDWFKDFNDQYGHATGDHVLKILVGSVKQSIRSDDAIGRLGGDEFGVIASVPSEEVAKELVERIKAMYAAEVRAQLPHTDIDATVSVGHAMSGEAHSSEDMLHLADTRMYEDKKARGRDARRRDPGSAAA